VLAVPHPARAMTNVASLAGLLGQRPSRAAGYFTTLTASFTVDVLLEPEPTGGAGAAGARDSVAK
jgi:hypothetical protein